MQIIVMGLFGPYVYKDKKNVKWYIHSRQKKKTTIYFFSKDPVDAVHDMPKGYKVIINKVNGLPMLTKPNKKVKK